jgi:hypothetical protein
MTLILSSPVGRTGPSGGSTPGPRPPATGRTARRSVIHYKVLLVNVLVPWSRVAGPELRSLIRFRIQVLSSRIYSNHIEFAVVLEIFIVTNMKVCKEMLSLTFF